MSMSIASLGSALNSDFDEDDPYNRENNKDYTIRAFDDLENAGYSLMTDSGNAYTWGYVDHLINMDLDSSRYVKSGASVPFLGAVLHGYVQFAGTPLNEEGDTDYAILKAIENGAGLYFILSYQNVSELKEDTYLSQYYGIRYDIWKEDMIEYYKELNDLLKDVQLNVIVNHEFLPSERVLNLDELEADLADKLQDALDDAAEHQTDMEMQKYIDIAQAFQTITDAETLVADSYQVLLDACAEIDEAYETVTTKSAKRFSSILENLLTEMTAIYETVGEDLTIDEVMEYTTVLDPFNDFTSVLGALKADTVNILYLTEKLPSYRDDVLAAIAQIDVAKQILAKGVAEGYLSAEVAEIYYAKAEEKKQAVDHYKLEAELALLDLEAKGYTTPGSPENVVDIALSPLMVLSNPDSLGDSEMQKKAAQELCALPAVSAAIFTADDLEEAVQEKLEADAAEKEDADNKGDSSGKDIGKMINNRRVVAVTYGDRNAATGAKTAVKTFLLNYNSYTARVSYNDVTYTIPSGGYVVIEY